jgi:hypothetical protein
MSGTWARSGSLVAWLVSKVAMPAFALLLLLLVQRVDPQEIRLEAESFTRAELDAAIMKAADERTRLEGLEKLIWFAGYRLYETSFIFGDKTTELGILRGDAAKAVWKWAEPNTVSRALESPNRSLRFWAVMSFETSFGKTQRWEPVVPQLAKHLLDPDSDIRAEVAWKLRWYPNGKKIIAERAPHETDPWVLANMTGSCSNPPFYGHLFRVLRSRDRKVREHALTFIYGNLWTQSTARMWRLGFDRDIYVRVVELTGSDSESERKAASQALEQLERLPRN